MKPMSIFGKIKSYAMIAHAFFWVVGAGYLKRHNKDHVYPLVEKVRFFSLPFHLLLLPFLLVSPLTLRFSLLPVCHRPQGSAGLRASRLGRVRYSLPSFASFLPSKPTPFLHAHRYCFGGMIGVHLAKDPSPIDVVVALHAGSVTAKDFAEIRKPFALICSEGVFAFLLSLPLSARTSLTMPLSLPAEDLGFDPVKTAALAELKKLQTPVIVHDAHPGATHGFAIRPNLAEPLVKTAFERAMVQTTECFAKEV